MIRILRQPPATIGELFRQLETETSITETSLREWEEPIIDKATSPPNRLEHYLEREELKTLHWIGAPRKNEVVRAYSVWVRRGGGGWDNGRPRGYFDIFVGDKGVILGWSASNDSYVKAIEDN